MWIYLFCGILQNPPDAQLIQKCKQSLTRLHVPMVDTENENLLNRLHQCIDFIEFCLTKSIGRCLVHCVAGVSRSAAVAIGYIMKVNQWSYEKAFDRVKSKRSVIEPNAGFVHQLRIFGRMGCRIDANEPAYRKFALEQLHLDCSRVIFGLEQRPQRDEHFKQIFGDYCRTVHDDDTLKAFKLVFKCRKCRMYLFSDRNLIDSYEPTEESKETTVKRFLNNYSRLKFTRSTLKSDLPSPPIGPPATGLVETQLNRRMQSNHCNSYFIEPMPWMQDALLCSQGVLTCHHCFTKLGSFDWNGVYCDSACRQHDHVQPAFKIDLKKVDVHEF